MRRGKTARREAATEGDTVDENKAQPSSWLAAGTLPLSSCCAVALALNSIRVIRFRPSLRMSVPPIRRTEGALWAASPLPLTSGCTENN